MTEREPSVLVVEDDRRLASLVTDWLSPEYRVETVHTGPDGLAAVSSGPDVVLLDRRLPGFDGHRILDEIREGHLDCRVALLTAVEPDLDIIDMPFDEYITKPTTETEVRATVERLLTRAEYADEIQAYYALSTKLATLESALDEDRLAESEAYQNLLAEEVDRRAALEEIETRVFANDSFEMVVRDLTARS